ncbi:MAG: hypothetical protein MUF54_14000 [Polyangiaceae bacterium]|jgi:hypothetical protein|nr:hypothetical protein [Polyangiaceae bacterium]
MSRGDLFVLVADRDIEAAVLGVLSQPKKLGVRVVSAKTVLHQHHDPGCLRDGVAFMRERRSSFGHALVVFDHDGCGRESDTREQIESDMERELGASGWGDDAAAIVISPEIETWVWSDSPQVDEELGWAGRTPALRTWLRQRGFEMRGPKPLCPREALHAALREARRQPSPVRFQRMAERVSLRRCIDPAFQKLERVLRAWFPSGEERTS